MAEDLTDAHLYLTVADEDENQVLEFVRVSGADMYIRENRQWVEIDPDDDNDRVWDRIIIDVQPEAVSVFDTAEAAGEVTADLFDAYVIPFEEGAPLQ